MIPGVAITVQRFACADAFGRDQPFECREPVPIIGLAGVGIAGGLRALDLGGEC
jgi:hypothetical protein